MIPVYSRFGFTLVWFGLVWGTGRSFCPRGAFVLDPWFGIWCFSPTSTIFQLGQKNIYVCLLSHVKKTKGRSVGIIIIFFFFYYRQNRK